MRQTGFRRWTSDPLTLAPDARGSWIRIVADGFAQTAIRYATAELQSGSVRGQRVFLFRHRDGRFSGVVYAPPDATTIRLGAYGILRRPQDVGIADLRPISSAAAALHLVRQRPSAAAMLFRGRPAVSPSALKARFRAMATEILAHGSVGTDYPTWLETFATWSTDDLPDSAGAPGLGLLVFGGGGGGGGGSDAERATLDAIARQFQSVPFAMVGPSGDWRRALASLELGALDQVGILQAGEMPWPHASVLARDLLRANGNPGFATTDEDCLTERGERIEPFFKPRPNHALMLSGTLSRGLWFIRRDRLDACAPEPGGPACRHAETFRLATWLAGRRAGGEDGVHLPHILASRHAATEPATPAALHAVVSDHLRRARLPFVATPTAPIRLTPRAVADPVAVTAIVPSTLRPAHAEACLSAILSETSHAAFDIVVAVAQAAPLDAAQRAVAERLTGRFPNVRIRHLPSRSFNFSWTVNEIARALPDDRHVLILNDDVSPLDPDWLVAMTAHLADARVGAVGAKLLYPSGAIQHAGVIIGLAGLCEHAFRNQPGDIEGYGHRATLPQRMLAVTGACLLVRAGTLRAIGYMDEDYPSAFNDVDLCLRIDEAGFEIVYAAEARLTHHELQTYVGHHAGDRAPFMEAEIARMRARWKDAVADDPYYNPNLDLRPEYAFTRCIPPRLKSTDRGQGAAIAVPV